MLLVTGCASTKDDEPKQEPVVQVDSRSVEQIDSACRVVEKYALVAALAKAADVEQPTLMETLDVSTIPPSLQHDISTTISTAYFLPIEDEEGALACAAYMYKLCMEKNDGYR